MAEDPTTDARPADDRVERERAFHDARFSDDSARAAAGRFYELAVGAAAEYRRALDAIPAGASVLEYGAGTGGPGFDLARRGVDVTGIDISPVAVELANEAVAADPDLDPATCRYVVMDAERLDAPDASFDAVFGSGILHHLDLDASFAEIARVLRPDGVGVFFEPLGHNPAINLYRRLTPSMRSPDEHPLVAGDLAGASRWFGDVEVSYHVLSTFAALPLRGRDRYQRTIGQLDRFDAALFRRAPALGRYAWIAVIRLRPRRPSGG
jgi:SAM-dependent methyltransferase